MLKWFKGKKKKEKSSSYDDEYSTDSFEIHLLTKIGRKIEGELIRIQMDGITATFPAERWPDYKEEEEIKLEFTKVETEREFVVRAILVEISQGINKVDCDFKFPDPKLFISELNAEDFSAANRRQSFRMEPLNEDEITVDLAWNENSARGWINDISVTGMGLGITKELAPILGTPENLRMTFTLPDNETPLQITGKVLYHKPGSREGTVHCGVVFDQEKPGGFLAEDKAISTFLNNQQKEMLKKRANLR